MLYYNILYYTYFLGLIIIWQFHSNAGLTLNCPEGSQGEEKSDTVWLLNRWRYHYATTIMNVCKPNLYVTQWSITATCFYIFWLWHSGGLCVLPTIQQRNILHLLFLHRHTQLGRTSKVIMVMLIIIIFIIFLILIVNIIKGSARWTVTTVLFPETSLTGGTWSSLSPTS